MKPVIVFDLDDTLFPWKEYVFSGFDVVGDFVKSNFKEPSFATSAKKIFNEGKRQKIFNATLDKLNIGYTPSLIKELLHIYRSHTPSIKLFPDAKKALTKLYKTHHLALLTDGLLTTQVNKFKALHLDQWIHFVIYTDEFGDEAVKPNPLGYQKIMDHFSAPPSQCTYIGDNPLKDFAAPRILGWQTIRIQRPGGEYERMRVFDPRFDADMTYTDLLPLLQSF